MARAREPDPSDTQRETAEAGAPATVSGVSAVDGADLFPSLQRLAQSRKGKIPFVQQVEWTDCGAACVTMVLRYFGRHVTLEEVREAIGGGGREATTALAMVRGAEWYGLRARAVSLEVDQMKCLPAGTILHWEFKHFVVFERMTRKGAELVDPARGRRYVDHKTLREAFTGVALVFETTDSFQPKKPGAGRLGWYMRQLASQRHVLVRIVVTSLLLRVFALALPLVTAVIVDRVIPRGDRNLLEVVAIGLGGLIVFQTISTLVRSHLLLQLRTNLDTRLTLGFVDYLSRLPFNFFQRRSAGDLMMRVNNNATVREVLTANALSALLDGTFVLGYFVLLFFMTWQMALVVLGLGLVQLVVFFTARTRMRYLLTRALDAQARSQSYLVELLGGISTLKAAAAEARAVEKWSNLYVDELNAALDRGRMNARVDAVTGLLSSGSPLLVLVIGALYVLDGSLTLGAMLAVVSLAAGLLGPLTSMVQGALQLQLLGGYMDRIEDVLNQQPEQTGEEVARAPKLSGRVTMQHVSFKYTDKAPLVVRDVSIDLQPGMTVAIVGRSGSGKSTVAGLLAGLHRPVEGRILFDGHDMTRLDLRSLRRQIGVVFQQPFVFAGSVRSNIALTDPGMPLDRVVAAAKLACIHDDIDTLPMGYETILADAGSSLSGGQRQRIALARAIVHRPAILILDEATSSLDAETERDVMANLGRLGCTKLVLAHRLSTIVNADQILVMDKGEVVEAGTHDQLMAANAHYSRLVAAQVRAKPGRGVA
ncbi:MAG TPA: peptidase domain-containing ABC transporter [Kofleriaceae bacterium]|nr:peptidase domain-containing ABC transporter [Kofleriaceae bacterium]